MEPMTSSTTALQEDAMKRRLLIDTDPATGVPNRDVDDGLALLVLLASPEVEVEGVTVTFGNVPVDRGFAVAQELLGLAGVTVPLHKGAGSRKELGRPSEAVDFLIETVRKSPGEISLLALGPLTNIATAMAMDPAFAPNLRELVVMGGSLCFKPFSFFGELNFHLDGRAAAAVLEAPVPTTLITMDVCSQAVFREAELRRVVDHDSDMARHLAKAIGPWLALNRRVFFKAKGFFPWDVVAASWLIDPTLFDERPCSLSVRPSGLRSGSIHDRRLPGGLPKVEGRRSINLPSQLDSERFMKLFLERLLRF
ncbi:MAG: nucleoside hydrolase [Spirochaetota bacterium]